jgi:hypothetical protein
VDASLADQISVSPRLQKKKSAGSRPDFINSEFANEDQEKSGAQTFRGPGVRSLRHHHAKTWRNGQGNEKPKPLFFDLVPDVAFSSKYFHAISLKKTFIHCNHAKK